MAEPRHVPLSFRPARVARDEEFDETVFVLDHIAKPINVAEMYETMAKWIKPKADMAIAAPRSNLSSASNEWI